MLVLVNGAADRSHVISVDLAGHQTSNRKSEKERRFRQLMKTAGP
jgi:hypothetical protein